MWPESFGRYWRATCTELPRSPTAMSAFLFWAMVAHCMDTLKAWLEANEHWVVPLGTFVTLAELVIPWFWNAIVNGLARLWRHRPRIMFGDPVIPATRLTFVLDERISFWTMGGTAEEPGVQIAAGWFVTNVGRQSKRILSTRILRPNAPGECHITTAIHPSDGGIATAPDDVLIGRNTTAMLSVHGFMIRPPPQHKRGTPLKLRIAVVDQYQTEHRSPLVLLPNR
jgi:hypothetical protein